MPDAAPARIFIVDDDQGLLSLIERTLQREGYTTATASSGKDAIEWLARNAADLMLLDLQLHDIEGKGFIGALSDMGRSIPFIIITGQGDERVAVEMMRRGAMDYLIKDVDFLQFVPEVVRHALEQLAKEKRLTEAEEQARLGQTVLQQVYSSVLVTTLKSPDPRVVYVNPAFTELTGCVASEVIGLPLTRLESLTSPMPELLRALADGRPLSGERLLRTKDGQERVVDCYITPVLDRDGRRTHWVAIQHDITARKRAEVRERLQYATTRALAQSTTLFEAAPKVLQAVCVTMDWDFGEFWRVDREAGVLEFVESWQPQTITSPEFAALTRQTTFGPGVGLPGRVWASGQPVWIADVSQDANFPRASAAMELGLHGGFAFPLQVENEFAVLAFFSRQMREPEPELTQAFLAIGNQVGQFMERERAEEALRRSEAILARAQDIAHLGSYEVNVAGTGGDHWSAEMFRILGLDPATQELTPSEYVFRCIHPEDQAWVREAFDKSRNERVRFDLEYRIVRPGGSIRHVHSIVEPVSGAGDRVVKLVGTLQDVTERKRLEREILEISEREQSRIGQDLHDGLCQHLAGIEFRLLDLKQKLEGISSKQAAETTNLAKLVRQGIEQTRTLARGLSPVMLKPDGLMNAMHELAINTERTFHISCTFACLAPVLIHDNAVATHLYRIAQEAVHNAIRHGQAKFIVINLFAQSDRVVLGVRDDGVGIPNNLREHKGMGLRVMQYRAGMVGGSLVVQREPEGGTSVICSLRVERVDMKPNVGDAPAGTGPRESPMAAVPTLKPRRGSQTRRGSRRKGVAPSD